MKCCEGEQQQQISINTDGSNYTHSVPGMILASLHAFCPSRLKHCAPQTGARSISSSVHPVPAVMICCTLCFSRRKESTAESAQQRG